MSEGGSDIRVVVAGTRTFTDRDLLFSTLDKHFGKCLSRVVVVSGAAAGADSLGEAWAAERGVRCERYPADWDRYGKRAGYLRNSQMADVAGYAIVFWDGKSKGSENMVNIAISKGLWVKVVKYG